MPTPACLFKIVLNFDNCPSGADGIELNLAQFTGELRYDYLCLRKLPVHGHSEQISRKAQEGSFWPVPLQSAYTASGNGCPWLMAGCWHERLVRPLRSQDRALHGRCRMIAPV